MDFTIARIMELNFEKNYSPNLFTWGELEYLVNIRPLMTADVVMQKEDHRWGGSPWSQNPNTYPPTLLGEILGRQVVHIRDMSRCTEKVNNFCKSLEDEYNKPVDAHIYICLNPSVEHPYGIHFDYSDNVIVQCEGSSIMKVWDKAEQDLIANIWGNDNIDAEKVNLGDPVMEVEMESGDVIWIPRHYPHEIISNESRLSVSFPMDCDIDERKFNVEDRNWVKLNP